MKRTFKSLVVGSLVCSMLLGTVVMSGFTSGIVKAEDSGAQNKKVITVSGMAKITVNPDIAYVNVGVETDGKTAVEAGQLNAKKITDVLNAVKALGIESKDLKTSNYYVYPTYSYDDQTPKLIGYKATNTIEVTIRDLTKVGTVIDTATKSGANVANGVTFGIIDESAPYNEALANALKNAQAKATSLANVIDIKLGKPSRISENSYGGGTVGNYVNYTTSMKAADSAEYQTPIEQGKLEISASVSVEYEY